MTIRVRYLGHVGQLSGYGYAAHDYMEAMRTVGIEFDVTLGSDARLDRIPSRYAWIRDYVGQKPPGWATHAIVHCVPAVAAGWRDILYSTNAEIATIPTVLMTTWETSKIPNEYVELLNSFAGIIVPSGWNRNAFLDSGVRQVDVVPHGFSSSWWHAPRPPRASQEPYRLYSIMTWSERKNPMGLLRAYWTEFRADENILLSIVTPNYSQHEVEECKRGLGLPAYAPVEFVGLAPNRLTDEALRDLHFASDCYVTAARGEGWGLGAFEATLVGNTVIAPDYGGFKEFLPLGTHSMYIRTMETPAVTPLTVSETRIQVGDLSLRPILHNQPHGIRGDQAWAEPDLMHLRLQMRRAFTKGRQVPLSVDHNSRWTLQQHFGAEAIGKRLQSVLEAIR